MEKVFCEQCRYLRRIEGAVTHYHCMAPSKAITSYTWLKVEVDPANPSVVNKDNDCDAFTDLTDVRTRPVADRLSAAPTPADMLRRG